MVIANMIGTGIFTTLGYQVDSEYGIPDPFAILIVWLIGGIISFCGATVYGEIATTIRKSGGEYSFLSTIYHPVLGFISGWVSIIVGFSASIAALSLAAGEYFLPITTLSKASTIIGIPVIKLCGIAMIILVTFVHLKGIKIGSVFQNFATYTKLGLILVFITLPFIFFGKYNGSEISFLPTKNTWEIIFGPNFASALVWVMFAYSGWNASTYVVGNLENPKKNLPFSLIYGTLIVTVLYLLLNFIFMYVSSFDELALQTDLGNKISSKILGENLSLIFSGFFSIALISGLSAMLIAGPRVIQVMGRDYMLFNMMGKQSKNGAPKPAIIVMSIISIVMVVYVDFQSLIEYTGFTLSIFSLLTVFGVFILRNKKIKDENIVKSLGYPFTPIVFSGLSIWMIYYFIIQKPEIVLWFLFTVLIPLFIFLLGKSFKKNLFKKMD